MSDVRDRLGKHGSAAWAGVISVTLSRLTVDMIVRSIEMRNWANMSPANRHARVNPVTKGP